MKGCPSANTQLDEQSSASEVTEDATDTTVVKYLTPMTVQYYDNLTRESLEDQVDHIWSRILVCYFNEETRTSVRAQARLEEGSLKKVDFSIEFLPEGKREPYALILIENKRPSYEGQTQVWFKAFWQLAEYMRMARKTNIIKRKYKNLYGVLNIGRLTRFYTMKTRSRVLKKLPCAKGKTYHLKNDAPRIEEVLETIKRASLPRK